MTESPNHRRKTEQVIKVSATWTPGTVEADGMSKGVFGSDTPLRIRGGRLTINTAIAIDMTDPAQATRVAERVQDIRKQLAATGTVHTFQTQAGSAPLGEAVHLPAELLPADDPHEPRDEDVAAQGEV